MTSKETIKWAAGQLHNLLGYSDNNLAEYICALARKSKSPSDLRTRLIENDIEDSLSALTFCQQLYAAIHQTSIATPKIASTGAFSNSMTMSTHGNIALAKPVEQGLKNSSSSRQRAPQEYDLVDMDEQEQIYIQENHEHTYKRSKDKVKDKVKDDVRDSSVRTAGHRERERDRHVRKHDKERNSDTEEDPTQVRKRAKDRDNKEMSKKDIVKPLSLSAKTPADGEVSGVGDVELDPAAEKKLDEDIRERDEFVARLLEREEQRTKKLEPQGLTAAQLKELATRGTVSSTDRGTTAIDMLREVSRQQYLAKREDKELKLLELSLRDEDYLFEDVPLTEEERRRREVNERVLQMARDKQRFDYKEQGFSLSAGYEDPDTGLIDKAKREAALLQVSLF